MNIDELEITEIGQLVTILKMLAQVKVYINKTDFEETGISQEIHEFKQELQNYPSHVLVAYMTKTFEENK